MQPSSPTAARPCVVPQIVFPYDFPLFFSSSYFNDIIIHSILQCTSLGTSSQLRDDEMLMMIIITATHSSLSLTLYVRADNENFAQNHQRSLGLEFPSQFISFATTTARMQYPDSQSLVLLPLWRHAHDLITLNPLDGGVETPTDQRIIFPAISSAQHHTLPNNHCPYNE